MRGNTEPWEGGYVRKDARGRSFFVIRRRVEGKQYDVSTRATTHKAAMDQLKRFEADPANYSPAGPEKKKPIYLDDKLGLEFLAFCRDVKKNSALWLGKQ